MRGGQVRDCRRDNIIGQYLCGLYQWVYRLGRSGVLCRVGDLRRGPRAVGSSLGLVGPGVQPMRGGQVQLVVKQQLQRVPIFSVQCGGRCVVHGLGHLPGRPGTVKHTVCDGRSRVHGL